MWESQIVAVVEKSKDGGFSRLAPLAIPKKVHRRPAALRQSLAAAVSGQQGQANGCAREGK